MGSKREHHFVPRFYLKQFASVPHRINIYAITTGIFIENGGLKEQCRKPRFHGKDDRLENAIADFEDKVAPALAGVVNTSTLPRPGTAGRTLLSHFVTVQALRTPKTFGILDEGVRKALAHLGEEGQEDAGQSDDHDIKIQILIMNINKIAPVFADLGQHLIVSTGEGRFITSDNPGVRYNKFCEGITDIGVLGARSKGILVVTPLSPTHLVILYDTEVYKLGEPESSVTAVADIDTVEALNSLQCVSADRVLLFSRWSDRLSIERLVTAAGAHRAGYSFEQMEYPSATEPATRSLLHGYERMPNLELRRHSSSFVAWPARCRSMTGPSASARPMSMNPNSRLNHRRGTAALQDRARNGATDHSAGFGRKPGQAKTGR